MASGRKIKNRPEGYLIGIIGDEDTVTGFLLAGIGQNEANKSSNYFVVDAKDTPIPAIEDAFKDLTERDDIAILLINQYIANKIRPLINKFSEAIPAILEIPSKEHPYDPSKDSILQRVRRMLGSST
eukprot:Plantae.Rhodophyta-Hildenbrandia_rubra.ctg11125.p1 GENE.Plantae.Rhodophyta-Hildenbrandia_rubra.ctg11125~~Plantae.Rhodophyta-Hildenbrandia_rubra.ctg11125.p1  ORF type:complete len:127 (-),score=23.14 Plantae.Rhodophyta-Hildenbrandia_rubra.ctg11125:752-1132(-)